MTITFIFTFTCTGQFRFTPPTHTLVAFHTALKEHVARGGIAAANARFSENQRIISEGLGKLGYKTFVDPKLQVCSLTHSLTHS